MSTVMNFGKTFFACFLAVIGASIAGFVFNMFIFFSIIGLISSIGSDSVEVKENSILKITTDFNITEISESNPFKMIDFQNMRINKTCGILDLVNAISKASQDPNISGIVIETSPKSELSSEHAYQLRSALQKFHNESGKFILAFGDTFTVNDYWLASVADNIYVNPQGAIDWIGISGTFLYFKDALDKLGVEPQIFRVGKFKSAVEPYMRSEMSDENRLQYKELLSSIWNQIVSDVSEAREIAPEKLNAYADSLKIVTPEDALAYSMVDSLAFKNDFLEKVAQLSSEEKVSDINFVDIISYASQSSMSDLTKYSSSKVAVLATEGEMVDVESSGESCIVGQNLADEIDKLRADSSVKAVVLRINSPGGSVMAAATIYNSMLKLREVKPVVVSMGNYAASGGYYVSAPADAIIASPVTLTGSIGVFGMVFNVGKAIKQLLGVNVQSVTTNANSSMSILEPLTDTQKAAMQKSIEKVYNEFVTLVSKGRNMSYDSVNEIAGGRVWTGTMATKIGLVDKVGTIDDAIELAAEKAGLTDYKVSVYPKSSDDFMSSMMSGMSASIKQEILGDTPINDIREEIKSKEGIKALMPYILEIK